MARWQAESRGSRGGRGWDVESAGGTDDDDKTRQPGKLTRPPERAESPDGAHEPARQLVGRRQERVAHERANAQTNREVVGTGRDETDEMERSTTCREPSFERREEVKRDRVGAIDAAS